jgi:hypothetical protein
MSLRRLAGQLIQRLTAMQEENRSLRKKLEAVEVAIREAARVSDVTDRELAESAFRQATQLVNTCIAEVIEHGAITDIRGVIHEIKRETQDGIPAIAETIFNSMRALPLRFARLHEALNKVPQEEGASHVMEGEGL